MQVSWAINLWKKNIILLPDHVRPQKLCFTDDCDSARLFPPVGNQKKQNKIEIKTEVSLEKALQYVKPSSEKKK